MPGSRPPDIEQMRAAASAVLGDTEPLPRFDDLAEATERLRRHLHVLIPVVQDSVDALPTGDVNRAAMHADVQNARARMQASPGPGLVSATRHARSLARELQALCDRHETLAGATAQEPA
jgi:hypothetical protein